MSEIAILITAMAGIIGPVLAFAGVVIKIMADQNAATTVATRELTASLNRYIEVCGGGKKEAG